MSDHLVNFGLVGLYLFAGFAWLGVAPAVLGLTMLMGALALHPQARREELPRELLILPWLALYLALNALWGVALIPSTGELRWDAFKDHLWLLAFVPIAFGLRGDERRLGWVGFLALTGFLLGMITHADGGLFTEERQGFQVGALPFGLYSGTAILGLLLFPPRRAWVWPIWGLALVVLMEGFILSEARSAWLSAVLVFPVALAFRYPWRSSSRKVRLVAMLVLAMAGGMVLAHWPLFKARLALPASIEALWAGNVEDDASLSISHRLWLWQEGIERWKEHPLLGWGIGGSAPLLEASPWRFEDQKPFAHFHNVYLQFLVEQGLLGVALWLALVLAILGRFLKAFREGRVPRPVGVFLLGALVFWCLWSFFDVRLSHTDGRFYWLLLIGAMTSFELEP